MPIKKNHKSLFHITEIKEEMRLIEGSVTDYITPSGNVYKSYGNNMFFLKKKKPNINNGYVYIGITMADGKNKSSRVHRLVAMAYLDNPEKLNIVGHKNNIKHDNRVENLYWTTVQENTQKAYNDFLIANAKGFDDSQSMPIIVYKNGEFYKEFGSLRICAKELNIPIKTIIRRAKNDIKTQPRKYKEFEFYFK